MADYDNRVLRGQAGTAGAIDAGLRSYMLRVYNYMLVGLVLTGAAAWVVANVPDVRALFFAYNPQTGALGMSILGWIALFAPLGLVLLLSFRLNKMSLPAAQATFWGYAAIMGIGLAPVFLLYTGASVAQTFFITAATFGAMSLWGYTTRTDLTGFGSFLFMGLIGIVIASVVNIFVHSTMMSWIVSVAGVLIFTGLTAYGHPVDQEQLHRVGRRRDGGQEGGVRSAQALPRLREPVRNAAAPDGQPPLGPHARKKKKAPVETPGLFLTRRQRLHQRLVEHAQHLGEVVAALEDEPGGRDHGIHALLAAQLRPLLDAKQRHLAGAPEDGEHRRVLQEIDGVIAPFAGGHHAAVKREDAIEFAAVEAHLRDVRADPPWETIRAGGAPARRNAMGSSAIGPSLSLSRDCRNPYFFNRQHHAIADGGQRHVHAGVGMDLRIESAQGRGVGVGLLGSATVPLHSMLSSAISPPGRNSFSTRS